MIHLCEQIVLVHVEVEDVTAIVEAGATTTSFEGGEIAESPSENTNSLEQTASVHESERTVESSAGCGAEGE